MLLKQKSRIKWLGLGDANNWFFFNSFNSRQNLTKILTLTDDTSKVASSHKEISNTEVNYFRSILGVGAPTVPIPPDLAIPCLSSAQQDLISKNFTLADVFNSFKTLEKNKCPDPDGFTSEFYIAVPSVVGREVTAGILHFFDTLSLPRS